MTAIHHIELRELVLSAQLGTLDHQVATNPTIRAMVIECFVDLARDRDDAAQERWRADALEEQLEDLEDEISDLKAEYDQLKGTVKP